MTVVAGKKIAVAVPQREQVEHLVSFAAARRPQFHGQRMLYWSWIGWPPRITVRLMEFWVRKAAQQLERLGGVANALPADVGENVAVAQSDLLKDRIGLDFGELEAVGLAVRTKVGNGADLGEERGHVVQVVVDGRAVEHVAVGIDLAYSVLAARSGA